MTVYYYHGTGGKIKRCNNVVSYEEIKNTLICKQSTGRTKRIFKDYVVKIEE